MKFASMGCHFLVVGRIDKTSSPERLAEGLLAGNVENSESFSELNSHVAKPANTYNTNPLILQIPLLDSIFV